MTDETISQILETIAYEAPISGNHLAQARVLIAAKMYADKPAQPDCRTCRQFHWSQFTADYRCHFIKEGGSCVNGDKHFAVPAVVLWRTE